MVVLINSLLNIVMGRLVTFERHLCRTDESSALCIKLVLAQYSTSAIIPVIASADLQLLADMIGVTDMIAPGFSDFTTQWCAFSVTRSCLAPNAVDACHSRRAGTIQTSTVLLSLSHGLNLLSGTLPLAKSCSSF